MALKDRPRLPVGVVKDKTLLVADDEFRCITGGTILIAERDEGGKLFVPCEHGRHYLYTQQVGDHYFGFTRYSGKPPGG